MNVESLLFVKRRFLAIRCQTLLSRLNSQDEKTVNEARKRVLLQFAAFLKSIETSISQRMEHQSNDGKQGFDVLISKCGFSVIILKIFSLIYSKKKF